MTRARRIALTATVLAGVSSIAGIAQADATPQPETAAGPSCGWQPSTNGGGSMRTNKPMFLRDGPAAACDTMGWDPMSTGQLLWVRCKTRNDSGNTWYYVRPEPPAGEYWDPGWIYSGNVTSVPSGIPSC
ncbi:MULTISPECIES: hypothetical protein [Actinomadura]|uniref:SH3 domain-containing protein n=1 Tax=Actinomadura yumaensis TaxID=111807 RepID=A0ABW2CJP3_9ACTN|nr:hypothetical protein [Actinomadura sp. J1-007]MWK39968.1 hypothetical protein [Actinomadura sp. J1-007]